MKLVSVIVPVYNSEEVLKRCVDSILHQTYPKLEILLVDDGSSDSSSEICDWYSARIPQVLSFHKKNGGLSDARNFGTRESSGEYVCYVDADDFIGSNYVRALVASIESEHSDISMCGFEVHSEEREDHFCPPKGILTGEEFVYRSLATDEGWKYIVAWNKLFKRSVLGDSPFEYGKYFEDEFSLVKLYLKRKIAVTSLKEYHYVLRTNSITTSSYNEKKLTDTIEFHMERLTAFSHYKKILCAEQYRLCLFVITARELLPSISHAQNRLLQSLIRKNFVGAVSHSRITDIHMYQFLLAAVCLSASNATRECIHWIRKKRKTTTLLG